MKFAYLVFIATTIAMSQQDAQSVANLIKVRQLTLSLINRELTLSNSFQVIVEDYFVYLLFTYFNNKITCILRLKLKQKSSMSYADFETASQLVDWLV